MVHVETRVERACLQRLKLKYATVVHICWLGRFRYIAT